MRCFLGLGVEGDVGVVGMVGLEKWVRSIPVGMTLIFFAMKG